MVHPRSGYQLDVFLNLKKQAEPLSDNERWVCLLHDEISLKSGLVYDKRSGELVGYMDTSQWKGSAEEEQLATHALVFMVVGITSNIKMSIGYFPTRTATADEIFPLLWQAVGLLESVCNLKVGIVFGNITTDIMQRPLKSFHQYYNSFHQYYNNI